MLRRPLRLWLICGCVVSLWSSGRVSVRLIADGMVSFAFVPFFEVASLAVVYRRAPRRVSFAQAADLFFVANAPWLLWLTACAALRCIETPTQAGAPPLALSRAIGLSVAAVAGWSAYIDLQFFRSVLPRPSGGSLRDLMLQRAVGWALSLGYFFGLAAWPEIVGRIV